MEEQISLTNLVSGYTANVRSLEREISTLQADAEELTREVEAGKEEREAAQANLDALKRQEANTLSALDGLRGDFIEAQFSNDVGEEQAIRRRKTELDAELAEIQEGIRNTVVPANDYGKRAAALQVEKESVGERLPKQLYLPAIDHEMLEFIARALKSDTNRLRKMHAAITLPSAPKEALQAARQRRGLKENVNPAFLRKQEEKREARRKEARRKNINAGEKMRRGGAPAHTGTTILADRMLAESTPA